MYETKFWVLIPEENKVIYFSDHLPEEYRNRRYILWKKDTLLRKKDTLLTIINSDWKITQSGSPEYPNWVLEDKLSEKRIVKEGMGRMELVVKITFFDHWYHFDLAATQDLRDAVIALPLLFNDFPYPRMKRIRQVRDALNNCQDPCRIEQIAKVLGV